MIDSELVVPGAWFNYPHPDGVGTVRTRVVAVLGKTHKQVRHESDQILRGAIDDLATFLKYAELP